VESFKDAWDMVCTYCKTRITDVAYNLWIGKIEPVKMDFTTRQATLLVQNEFHKQALSKGYAPLLNSAFTEIFGVNDIALIFITPEHIEKSEEKIQNEKLSIDSTGELTFDTYIVGASNKFAHAAALAVAANPAGAYNPLFIYGNSGLGKTHLLYAISNDMRKNHPNKVALYIKGDEFTNELIDSIRKGTTIDFHQKYRKVDILLVDDIQFIAGKDSTQEEFFHTFNTLYESRKQIVLTSDRPPKEIKTLEDRLRTRFEWGLIADIQPPDYETRIAIIKRKAEVLNIAIPEDLCNFIATKLKNNIRQLEGVVKKLKAYYLLQGDTPSMATTQSAISDILNNDQPPPVTIEKVIDEVAKTYNVTAQDIRSSRRSADVSTARQVAIYVAREITQLPLAAIGKEFGGRDHSTMVYALSQVVKNMNKDSRFMSIVEDMIKNIRDR
jgi:chromosomal replication initiator protein